MRDCPSQQALPPNFASTLGEIAGCIDAANQKISVARHHARLFADVALSASESVRTLQVESVAFVDAMVFLTSRLENVIDALADASAITAIVTDDLREPKR